MTPAEPTARPPGSSPISSERLSQSRRSGSVTRSAAAGLPTASSPRCSTAPYDHGSPEVPVEANQVVKATTVVVDGRNVAAEPE
jgi:hypothetical protein